MKDQFARTLRSQQRGFIVFLSLATLWLAVSLVRFAFYLRAGGAFAAHKEWGAILFLALPFIALGIFFRQIRRHRLAHGRFELSIQATLRAVLSENQMAQKRASIIAWLYVAMLLVIPIVVAQLRAVGKAGDEIFVPAFVILPTFVAVALIVLRVRHVRKLKPRERELEALLATYENKPDA